MRRAAGMLHHRRKKYRHSDFQRHGRLVASRQICNQPENDNGSRITNPAERLSWAERKTAAPDSGAAGC